MKISGTTTRKKIIIKTVPYTYISMNRIITSRREIVEDMGELQGTIADVKRRSEMVVRHVRLWSSVGLSSWVPFHDLWSSFSRQGRQRCAV